MARKPSSAKLVELAYTYAGVIQDIAAACNVSRVSVNNWKNKDEKFREALKNGNDCLVDLALNGLKHHLENKSEKSIHYTLDRLARDKGFGMLIQQKVTNYVEEKLKDKTDEELIEYAKEQQLKIVS